MGKTKERSSAMKRMGSSDRESVVRTKSFIVDLGNHGEAEVLLESRVMHQRNPTMRYVQGVIAEIRVRSSSQAGLSVSTLRRVQHYRDVHDELYEFSRSCYEELPCHITEIKVNITDLVSLALAAVQLGGELVEDVKTYKWCGTWVGDSPMPKGMTKADLGKCDHVIRFPGITYEVGVRRQEDGSFRLVYDWWCFNHEAASDPEV